MNDDDPGLRFRVDELRRRALEASFWVSLDGRVNDTVAADLVGRSKKTLQRWRASADIQIPFTRVRGLPTYALEDLVRYLDKCKRERQERDSSK